MNWVDFKYQGQVFFVAQAYPPTSPIGNTVLVRKNKILVWQRRYPEHQR